MSRLLLKKGQQKIFLDNIKEASGLRLGELAKICRTNPKQLSDWHTEKSTMIFDSALILSKRFSIDLPTGYKIAPNFWHTKKAGQIGGLKNIEIHGNPGTAEGRMLGGTRSLIINKKLKTGFKIRKKINIPRKDENLAELFGIIIGDGGLTYHQITISLSSKTDREYAEWVTAFIKKILDIEVSKKDRKRNVCQIVVSSVNLVEFLLKNGLSRGNKVKNQVDIPSWILENKNFKIACVRGLIDTDGCIYIDHHKYKERIYKNICLDFTSASPKLLNSAYKILNELNLGPKIYKKSIKIRKENNVKKYFKIIGSHNPKHVNKFKKFIKGEVA